MIYGLLCIEINTKFFLWVTMLFWLMNINFLFLIISHLRTEYY